jgi:uroporphyrinogen-III decarboxylase
LAAELLGSTEAMIATMENNTHLLDLLLSYCIEVVKNNAIAFIDAGADVIMILDPEASNLTFNRLPSESGMTGFEKYCEKPIGEVTSSINSLGIPVLLHTCVTRPDMLKPLAKIDVQGYSLDINVDMKHAYDVLVPKGSKKVVLGNIDTTLLCYGPIEKIREEVTTLLDKMEACKRFILATSCDIAPSTPSENIFALCQAYRDWRKQNMHLQDSEGTYADIISTAKSFIRNYIDSAA